MWKAVVNWRKDNEVHLIQGLPVEIFQSSGNSKSLHNSLGKLKTGLFQKHRRYRLNMNGYHQWTPNLLDLKCVI